MVAVNIFMNAAATQSYNHTNSLKQVTMNNEDMSIAARGMRFTQPDWLPDGLNPLSSGNFGGILNLNGKYDDTTGLAQQSSWSIIA